MAKFNNNGSVISKNVQIFNPQNVAIRFGTYFHSGQIPAGERSTIRIRKWCALGYNVHIKSRTHDPKQATGEKIKISEKDIKIGDNVYIKQGITIGDNVIIGANNIFTKNIPLNSVFVGCTVKLLYK